MVDPCLLCLVCFHFLKIRVHVRLLKRIIVTQKHEMLVIDDAFF